MPETITAPDEVKTPTAAPQEAPPPADPSAAPPAADPSALAAPPEGGASKPGEPAAEAQLDEVAFSITQDDGTKLPVTYKTAAEAVQLIKTANEKIAEATKYAEEIQQRHSALTKERLDNPIGAMFEELRVALYKGDRESTYNHLIAEFREIVKRDDEYQKLSPETKENLKYKRELAEKDAALKAHEEEKKRESALEGEARFIQKFKLALAPVLKEVGLSESPQIIGSIADYAIARRRAGVKITLKEAAQQVKASMDGQEDGLLKKLDIERIKKARPDLLKALQASELEAAKKARAEEAPKAAAANPGGKPGKILSNNDFFTSKV